MSSNAFDRYNSTVDIFQIDYSGIFQETCPVEYKYTYMPDRARDRWYIDSTGRKISKEKLCSGWTKEPPHQFIRSHRCTIFKKQVRYLKNSEGEE